jgi:hypothetical protein
MTRRAAARGEATIASSSAMIEALKGMGRAEIGSWQPTLSLGRVE